MTSSTRRSLMFRPGAANCSSTIFLRSAKRPVSVAGCELQAAMHRQVTITVVHGLYARSERVLIKENTPPGTAALLAKFSEICERCRLTRIAPNAVERSTEAHAEVVRPSSRRGPQPKYQMDFAMKFSR